MLHSFLKYPTILEPTMKYTLLFTLLTLSVWGTENSYRCTFDAYATPKGFFDKSPIKFTITTNDSNATFKIKRESGTTQGRLITANRGVALLEISKRGNITLTSMTTFSPIATPQKAVHTQNIFLGEKMVTTQHYGTCQYIDPAHTKKRHLSISKIKRHEIYQRLNLDTKLRTLSKSDARYVYDALSGVFPSRQEMESDMSIEGMILISKIMEEIMKIRE